MKLLLCTKCEDVVRLMKEPRTCQCGACSGRYLDDLNAEITDGIPIGFSNPSLAAAIRNRPASGLGERFEAFVIPVACESVTVRPRDILPMDANPKDGWACLLQLPSAGMVKGWYSQSGWMIFGQSEPLTEEPTGWLPLAHP